MTTSSLGVGFLLLLVTCCSLLTYSSSYSLSAATSRISPSTFSSVAFAPRNRLPALFMSSTPSPSPDRALLFDCDGVIILTEEIHRLAYNEAFKKHVGEGDFEWSVEYYDMLQNTVGGGVNKMRYYFKEAGWPGAWPETDEGRESSLQELQGHKTRIYQEFVAEHAVARPGILRVMDEALKDPKCKVGVCSASTKAAVETCLNIALGPERFAALDVFLAGDDVAERKPNPMIYTSASESAGVPPENCVVVEDSIIGLKAAKAAGMRCVVTYTESTVGEDFVGIGADAVVEDLGDESMTLDWVFSQKAAKSKSGEVDEGAELRELLMTI